VLKERAQNVTGILNGVDYEEWNPETDKFIAARYSAEELSGKQVCKRDLLASFGLQNADPNLPVVGIVSRFAAQKGFDLIGQVLDRLALEDVLLTVLATAQVVRGNVAPRPSGSAQTGGEGTYDNAGAQDRSRRDMFLAIALRTQWP
jgi:starch synthase